MEHQISQDPQTGALVFRTPQHIKDQRALVAKATQALAENAVLKQVLASLVALQPEALRLTLESELALLDTPKP